MTTPPRPTNFSLTGLWITIGVVALILGWRRWAIAQQPAHLREMADEIGAIAELRDPYLVANHAGTKMLINMDTKSGVGMYLLDVTSRKKILLYQENEKDYDWRQYKMLGWSPDDGMVAFGYQAAPKSNDADDAVPGNVIIADGNSGRTLARIRVARTATNTLYQFAWLSPKSFAYLNGEQNLFVYRCRSNAWTQARCFTNATHGGLYEAYNMTAYSSNAVTWEMRGGIWVFNLESGELKNIWLSITNNYAGNSLVSASYDPKSRTFLLVCFDTIDGQRLFEFNPARRSLAKLGLIPFSVVPGRPPRWILHHTGYVFLRFQAAGTSLMLSTNFLTTPTRLFKPGEIRNIAVRGTHIYIAGTLTNEPPSIYDYNLHSAKVKMLLSSATKGLRYTECVPFTFNLVTNAAGQVFSYHLWLPAHFSSSKRYPLIIGNSPYSWTPFPIASANAGYYFATVDRPSWMSPMDDWAAKLMTVYKLLSKNPNLDTSLVYLCVRSMEANGIPTLIAKYPKLWKGAILFDPTGGLPDLSDPYLREVFIEAGSLDTPVLNSVLKYRKAAENAGLPVTLVVLKATRHVSYGFGVQEQRIPALVSFLASN